MRKKFTGELQARGEGWGLVLPAAAISKTQAKAGARAGVEQVLFHQAPHRIQLILPTRRTNDERDVRVHTSFGISRNSAGNRKINRHVTTL